MVLDPQIFKDYDIRAEVPQQLDEAGIIRIAQAIVAVFAPQSVQLGHDMRLSYPQLFPAFKQAFLKLGVRVVDLGFIATDMIYYASAVYPEDLAITLSASHNPARFNGLKIVKKGAVPVSGETGIYALRDWTVSDKILPASLNSGKETSRDLLAGWVEHVLQFVDFKALKPFRLGVDAGNGMAGYFMPSFEAKLAFKVSRLYYELDGSFPHHLASPIESRNLQDLIALVKKEQLDAGLAFDGDGDRVFLVDETGRIVSGTIMTAIIAANLLKKNPGAKILYNAIVGRIVPETIAKNKGQSQRVRVGHTLIKAAMRRENALFCGEHSGHYYFKANFFADSAIIAALLVLEQMSQENKKLSQLVDEFSQYSALEEMNFKVENKTAIMTAIEQEFKPLADAVDQLDGFSFWFKDWWFNLRTSHTEPYLRLNLEADNPTLLEQKSALVINKLISLGAVKL